MSDDFQNTDQEIQLTDIERMNAEYLKEMLTNPIGLQKALADQERARIKAEIQEENDKRMKPLLQRALKDELHELPGLSDLLKDSENNPKAKAYYDQILDGTLDKSLGMDVLKLLTETSNAKKEYLKTRPPIEQNSDTIDSIEKKFDQYRESKKLSEAPTLAEMEEYATLTGQRLDVKIGSRGLVKSDPSRSKDYLLLMRKLTNR